MYQVYKIANSVNNKIYIGYTQRSLQSRMKEHLLHARKGSLSSLHKAIRKYGSEHFVICLLQQYPNREEMIQGEIFYIKLYNTYKSENGYNDTCGGDGGNTNGGKKFPNKWKIKIAKSQAGKSRKFSRKFSDKVEKQICKLYVEDQRSTYFLSKKFNCSRSSIISILNKNNIEKKKNNYTGHSNGRNIFSLEIEQQICQDYQSGQFSRADLAKKFKCGRTTIRDILLRHNIQL